MTHTDLSRPPESLPGVQKKSFAMAYGGGEIWFEHLDGMYKNETLVLEKLQSDIPALRRPSAPSAVAFNLDETTVTEPILTAVVSCLTDGQKHFTRVAFVGLTRPVQRQMKKLLTVHSPGFAFHFFADFEKAKEWLVSETV